MNAPHNNDDKKTPPMTVAEYQEQARQMSSNLKMAESQMREALGELFEPVMQDVINDAKKQTPEDGDVAATLLILSGKYQESDINLYMTLAALSVYIDQQYKATKLH
ncbi:hypothetical protein MAH1_33620 [Sessilibacter sp. MAH1]